MSIAGHFVWLESVRGGEPQKWPIGAPVNERDGCLVTDGRFRRILAKHPLGAEEYRLSIYILEQRYPPPPPEDPAPAPKPEPPKPSAPAQAATVAA